MVGTVPEHISSRSSPRARQWSEQSPSTAVVWAVPEHGSGLGNPRARQWSGPSLSTERAAKKRTPLVLLFGLFILSPYSVKSNLTRLVKKEDGYSTSLCLLALSGKQSLGTYMEVRQCGPSHTINEEARTLVMKGRVYWHRSQGVVNNRPPRVRTSPKKLGRTKRRYSLLFII